MAVTQYGVNHPLAVKRWCKSLHRDALQTTYLSELMGTKQGSFIRIIEDLSKDAGDSCRFSLLNLITGEGRSEGEARFGHEEGLAHYYDTVLINELWHGVKVPTNRTIDLQRFVHDDLRESGKYALTNWWTERKETILWNQICGNTAESRAKYYGFNTPVAPSANRIVRAAGRATDEALTSADLFDVSLIDVCLEKVKLVTPKIMPGIRRDGSRGFCMMISPEQATDMTRETTDGRWLSIELSKLQGGAGDKKSQLVNGNVEDGYFGRYKNVDIYCSSYLPAAINSSTGAAIANTKRAAFMGADAGGAAYAKGYAGSRFVWDEESIDYNKFLGIGTTSIFGFKKLRYTPDGSTGEDHGVITVPTYAAAHTS